MIPFRKIANEFRQRQRILSVALLVALAIGVIAVVISTILTVSPGEAFSTSTTGSVLSQNGHEIVDAPSTHLGAQPKSITMDLHFYATGLVNNETLLQLTPADGGLRISLTPPDNGTHDLVLSAGTGNNLITAVLVPHLRPRSPHQLTLKIERSGNVTASIDNSPTFFYAFGPHSIFLRPNRIAVGSTLDGTNPFIGSITVFRATTASSYLESGSGTKTVLRLLGIAFIVIAIAATAALFLIEHRRRPWQSLRRDTPISTRRKATWRVAIGLTLIAGGTLLMQYITPADNTLVHRIGEQTLSAWTVPTGQQSQYSLYSDPQLVQNATTADVRMTFQMRVTTFPQSTVQVIAGGDGTADLQLMLYDNGFFVANTPLAIIDEIWPIAIGVFPPGQWVSVEIDEQQNRTMEFRFNHQLAYSYTFNSKEWTVNPPQLSFGVPTSVAGISIRDAQLAETEYTSITNTDGSLRIRLLQLLAGLLVIAGTVVLASRFARKLVKRAPVTAAPLIKVAFGVAAIGTAINVLFLLHVHQTAAYYSNSSWLFAPGARFSDFTQTLELFISRDPYGIQRGGYPPFGYLLIGPFAWMSRYAGLFVFLSLFLGFLIWWVVRVFTKDIGRTMTAVVIAASLFSLPVTFAVDRANTDLIVVIFVILGGAALEQDRKTLSSFYFALVGAAKILPIAYLFVFLRWRRLRFIVVGFAIAGVITLISFEAFTGSVGSNISNLRTANDLATQSNLNAAISTPFNTGIQGWVQAIGFAVGGPLGGQTTTNYAHHYVLLEELVGGAFVGLYFLFFERTEWRLMTVATAAILLLPGVTGYYSLLYVFAPLALFVRRAPCNKRTIFIAVIFGLILMPKTYAFFGLGPYVDSSILVTAPLLMTLAGATVWDSVAERRQQKKAQKAHALELDSQNSPNSPQPVAASAASGI